MQQQRRHTPYPTTWEIPAAVGVLVLILGMLGVHVGRGTATLLAGHGWTWPAYLELGRSLPGVLAGDAAAGLTVGALPDGAAAPVLACVIFVEAILIVGTLVAIVVGWRRWGPGRMLGMATSAQAERVLGFGRLERVRHLIRPDLYPPKRSLR